MNIDILIEYCNKCEMYGWVGTWIGLKKYSQLRQKGLIRLWTA